MTILILILAMLALPQEPSPVRQVAPSNFVGTWVGVQTWAIDNPPPGAKEQQEVTLTIEEFGGKLVGSLTPFFGGADGASFVNGELAGETLQASGRFGQPPAGEPASESRNQPRGWKDGARIQFAFSADRNNLKGTADVQLNGVNWLKFNYDLSRKRSRY